MPRLCWRSWMPMPAAARLSLWHRLTMRTRASCGASAPCRFPLCSSLSFLVVMCPECVLWESWQPRSTIHKGSVSLDCFSSCLCGLLLGFATTPACKSPDPDCAVQGYHDAVADGYRPKVRLLERLLSCLRLPQRAAKAPQEHLNPALVVRLDAPAACCSCTARLRANITSYRLTDSLQQGTLVLSLCWGAEQFSWLAHVA